MDFDVKKYAKLARVKLTHEEEEKFQKDLGEILGHVDELNKVNVKGVEPVTGGTVLKNVFRDDLVRDTSDEEFNPGFPNKSEGYLAVPKVFEND
jgi:aspartyl-tRNA(Asn)/glutamyl-tRNA(Gln) amidotransferase subunit C